jgi:hypothetical protein
MVARAGLLQAKTLVTYYETAPLLFSPRAAPHRSFART